MAHQLRGYDGLIECPYNRAHQILASRMQFHLIKCRKNYPNAKMADCPFNKTHVIPVNELDHHVRVCPERLQFERYRYGISTNAILKEKEIKQKEEQEKQRKLLQQKKQKEEEEMADEMPQPSEAQTAVTAKGGSKAASNNAGDDDWSTLNSPTYDPQVYVQNAPVLRTLIGAQPAERRAFAKSEKQRLDQLRRK